MTKPTITPHDFYNKEALKYDEIRLNGDANTVNHKLQIDIIKNYIHTLNKDSKVLEIAPGTGRITQILANYFNHMDAIDISSDMLEKLKEKHWYSEKISLIHNDILQETPNKKYDLIIFINGASHFENFEEILKWCSKNISDSGEIFFNIPNITSFYFIPGYYINKKRRSFLRNVFTRWYTYKEISNISIKNHLAHSRYAGITHAPLGLPRFTIPLFIILNRAIGLNKYIGSQLFVVCTKISNQ